MVPEGQISADERPNQVFLEWAGLRLPTSAPKISEHGEDKVDMHGDELYELLRQACEHGYERGQADGYRTASAEADEFIRRLRKGHLPQGFLKNKVQRILTSGSRQEMDALERFIIERDPGPLNRESFAGASFTDLPWMPLAAGGQISPGEGEMLGGGGGGGGGE
ncbi:MAG: hypothetical protein JWM19_1791 [Actinomycetia bacterium]|nr:hypothetical protein [Actinomycetes bacterium]